MNSGHLVEIHEFLLQNLSTDNEVRVFQALQQNLGIYKTISFMYHVSLLNDLRIMTESAMRQFLDEEEQLATYINEMHAEVAEVEAMVHPDSSNICPFNFIETKSDCSSTSSTPLKRYQCNKCSNSYASKDGVRKHYKKQHGSPPQGPHNYCVTLL